MRKTELGRPQKRSWILLSLGLWGVAITCIAAPKQSDLDASRLRRPIALALGDEGRRLYVANRDSGSISLVDVGSQSVSVVGEFQVGARLSDVKWTKPDRLLVLDELRHELILAKTCSDGIVVEARVRVASYPVSLCLSGDASRVFIASLWSRRWTSVALADGQLPKIQAELDLPFAPREQCLLPDRQTLVVADTFGGHLGVIDLRGANLVAIQRLEGHNIRGLTVAADGTELLMVHPILHPEAGTTEGGVHWGGVMSNVVRRLPLRQLLGTKQAWHDDYYYLGHPDRATGDPCNLLLAPNGQRVVAYGGLGEVGVSDPTASVFRPVSVGRRPTALHLSAEQNAVFVANTFDDSISIVQLASPHTVSTISLGAQRTLTAAERGEILFYDARLASDGWFSCHGCHTDGHSNGGLSDTLGDDSLGAPKRVLSLLGVGQTAPWSWTGAFDSLEAQVKKSLESTMRGRRPAASDVSDLAEFLRSTPPAPGLQVARTMAASAALPALSSGIDARLQRGKTIFQTQGCADCHLPDRYTTAAVYDVGLVDEQGQREFNPPSLRGVSQRDRLFHDNRAAGLQEVFSRYQHGLMQSLTESAQQDLILFLQSL